MTVRTPKDCLYHSTENRKSIFLGGTIDNGDSENWQNRAIELLKDRDIVIYNPRNEKWDITMEPVISNPNFVDQVQWELEALEISTVILINFLPNSKSPISLLELGLYTKETKCLVVCPKEFYRSGNVHFVCKRYEIPLFDTLEEVINEIKQNYI